VGGHPRGVDRVVDGRGMPAYRVTLGSKHVTKVGSFWVRVWSIACMNASKNKENVWRCQLIFPFFEIFPLHAGEPPGITSLLNTLIQ
jgi:hypothetical protein